MVLVFIFFDSHFEEEENPNPHFLLHIKFNPSLPEHKFLIEVR